MNDATCPLNLAKCNSSINTDDVVLVEDTYVASLILPVILEDVVQVHSLVSQLSTPELTGEIHMHFNEEFKGSCFTQSDLNVIGVSI